MLKLTITVRDEYDESTKKFIVETMDIELEHSLASLSKWEEKWEIPLLSSPDKTDEQSVSYLECMCVTPDVAPEVFWKLTEEQQEQVSKYLEKKASATWFANRPEPRSGEAITAELVYYWMSGFGINWEAQHWHLNKLLTLIKVHSVKADNKPRQQSARNRQQEIMRLNAQRLKETGSNG